MNEYRYHQDPPRTSKNKFQRVRYGPIIRVRVYIITHHMWSPWKACSWNSTTFSFLHALSSFDGVPLIYRAEWTWPTCCSKATYTESVQTLQMDIPVQVAAREGKGIYAEGRVGKAKQVPTSQMTWTPKSYARFSIMFPIEIQTAAQNPSKYTILDKRWRNAPKSWVSQ